MDNLGGEKMHVLCDLLEEKHLSGVWMEKHVELHYLNFGGLEGIIFDHWAIGGTKYGQKCSGKKKKKERKKERERMVSGDWKW